MSPLANMSRKARSAVQVAKHGPKTEAERQQAIKTLRTWARQLTAADLHLAAGEARRLAHELAESG